MREGRALSEVKAAAAAAATVVTWRRCGGGGRGRGGASVGCGCGVRDAPGVSLLFCSVVLCAPDALARCDVCGWQGEAPGRPETRTGRPCAFARAVERWPVAARGVPLPPRWTQRQTRDTRLSIPPHPHSPPPPPCCNRSHALPCYYQCVPPPLNHLFSCPLLRLDNEEKGANSAAAADASATPPHPVHVGEPAGRPLPRSAPARPLAPNPTPPPCPSPAQIPPCPPPPSAPSSPSPQPTVPRTPPSHRALSCNENCEPDRQRRRRCHRRRRWRGR